MLQTLNKKSELGSSIKFEGLSEKEAVVLFRAGRNRKVVDGEYIVRKGEGSDGLMLIVEGLCAIVPEEDQHETLRLWGKRGDWFGTGDLSSSPTNSFSVVAAGQVRILELDRFAFNLLAPEIQLSVYRRINDTARSITTQSIRLSASLHRKVRNLASFSKLAHDEDIEKYDHSAMIHDLISSFPRLPIQINKLTSMLLDEGASVSEIVGFAKMDPSIVSVVLKTVNSGYYNFQRKISDFHHAFVLLGFNQVYQILMENFLQGIVPKHFNLKALNLHSAIISQIAFDISQIAEKSKPVMMSTLGILHDLGKCVILASRAKRPELDIVVMRLNDNKVGSLLLDAWSTPAIICRSVEYQKYPQFCPPKEIPEDCRESVAILHVAHLCFDCLSGTRDHESTGAFCEDYMRLIGLNSDSVESLVNEYILPGLQKKMDVFPDYMRDFVTNSRKKE